MPLHDSAAGTRLSDAVPLVWHQARRRASDPAHTMVRIIEGLRMDARVGIDIHPMSDGHFAVLQGPLLENETTGSGPVIRARARDLRELRRQGPDRSAIDEAPFTLATLIEAIGSERRGLLQINLRCGEEALRPGHEVGLARALRPFAGRALLLGRDVTALRRLGEAITGLRLGFVLADETAEWLCRTGDAQAFAARVVEAIPEAVFVQLSGRTILALEDEDLSLVNAFKAKGWQVEAQADVSPEGHDLWDVLRLISLGVDRITTRDPEGLRAALAGSRPPAGRDEHPLPSDGRSVEPGWRTPRPRNAA